jgi:UDP-glucose 4-epimerase
VTSVWITGARGFIGRNLSKWLSQQGYTVAGLGHGAWPEAEASQWGISLWLNGDILSSNLVHLRSALGVPDIVFHLAGGSSVGAALAAPREDFARTVGTTVELLEWMRREAPQTRLVVLSSAAVYGNGHPGHIDEGATLSPYSPYGHHKLMMEQLCRSYAASYGLASAVVRLFSVYGAGLKKQLLWDLCNKLSAGSESIELSGTGGELRDWTDIRDVVRVLDQVSRLATSKVPVLNGGSGVATSVAAIAEQLSAAWAGSGRAKALRFNGRPRPGDPFSLVAAPSRLQALGFEWRIPIAQGLVDYVHWYRGERLRGGV